jgi:hypothetical protein
MRNDELYDFYSSPNIIIMMKSSRMTCARQVTHMAKIRNAIKSWNTRREGTTQKMYVTLQM